MGGGTQQAPRESSGERSRAFAKGQVIDGKYAIEDTIAEGGIGVVVRATHTGLGQRVAIKYLKPRALRDPALVERFEREGRLAARITSEHVVRVQDVGRLPEAGPYMVMEYLVGRDLGSIVDEGPMPIPRAVDYMLQACDALAEAHALRIVHRDIKPDNLFLAQRPSNTAILKIIDFGISKVVRNNDASGSWRKQTGHQERFGTPLYMSPEQLRSVADVDQRTDVWSLGVVLFELVTGSAPFDGDDVPQLSASILTAAPRALGAFLPDAPQGLDSVILRCLEKDPARRFRNVGELAQALSPYGTPEGSSRVIRIQQVVRRGGQSIRPATPAAFAVQAVSAQATPTATSVPDRDGETVVLPRRRAVSPRAIGLAALGGIVVVSGIALLLSARSTPASAPVVTASAAAASVAASVVSEAPQPAPAPEVQTPLVATATAPVQEVAPSAAPAHKTLASRPSAAPAAAPRSDRRALFGDRK
ncbi:MAG: serine/threonine-protein kinase [Polyangiaceae bacterium]